jgi:hypothetical protein
MSKGKATQQRAPARRRKRSTFVNQTAQARMDRRAGKRAFRADSGIAFYLDKSRIAGAALGLYSLQSQKKNTFLCHFRTRLVNGVPPRERLTKDYTYIHSVNPKQGTVTASLPTAVALFFSS